MIWDEPLGFERWKAISHDLLAYLASICGKRDEDKSLYVAEGLYHHMLRVVGN